MSLRNFKEEDVVGLFDNRNPSECDTIITNLIEKNNTLKEKLQISKGNMRYKQLDSVR